MLVAIITVMLLLIGGQPDAAVFTGAMAAMYLVTHKEEKHNVKTHEKTGGTSSHRRTRKL